MKNIRKNNSKISSATIRRLSIYYRALDILGKNGIETVLSDNLCKKEGIPGTHVRKDLNNFGSFGKRGEGYNVRLLKNQIAKILGIDDEWNIALIGSVEFSTVLFNSIIFKKKHLIITKLFDDMPELVGKKINGITVCHIDNLEKELDPQTDKLAIVAVSPPKIQRVINRLGKIGLGGVLYFASRSVKIPKNMVVLNADISIELGTITYHITNSLAHHKRVGSTKRHL
jgi:redox-sensing transcriptional repressor